MKTHIQLTHQPVEAPSAPVGGGDAGAWVEFRGVVRGEESGEAIAALEYEAYAGMAEREIARLLQEMAVRHPCSAATVIHRVGVVPVGETAIYVGVAARHRGPAFALLTEFMDRLKTDVPIWKRRALPVQPLATLAVPVPSKPRRARSLSLVEALSEIHACCGLLPGIRVPLSEAAGRVLREPVLATEDSPTCDRSTRDGYAILDGDASESFEVVDTLLAADWKPRTLNPGEAVRVATGSALPGDNLRVIPQEQVQNAGGRIKITGREGDRNIRFQGQEMRAGDIVLAAGTLLQAGQMALLASVGGVLPVVSHPLHITHFTSGDEIVPPEQTPEPGQVRNSNAILIRELLKSFPGTVTQRHLPEDLEKARQLVALANPQAAAGHVILFSGGSSVGDRDFTRPLLDWLGYEIIFDRLNLRPGAPLIFAQKTGGIAFGLPGNPLSHFVCFHLFVADALARLTGKPPGIWRQGTLASDLDAGANPRETWWPAQWKLERDGSRLSPLPWSSSGDVSVLARTSALIRVPAHTDRLAAGDAVEFLTTNF